MSERAPKASVQPFEFCTSLVLQESTGLRAVTLQELAKHLRSVPESSIYFHTHLQKSGWPKRGYEVQINNSQADWRRTGGLYAIQDVKEAPAADDRWFLVEVRVAGKHVTVKVDGYESGDVDADQAVTMSVTSTISGQKPGRFHVIDAEGTKAKLFRITITGPISTTDWGLARVEAEFDYEEGQDARPF